jgi:hypothetical protein
VCGTLTRDDKMKIIFCSAFDGKKSIEKFNYQY